MQELPYLAGITTLHGRLDAWGIPELIGEFADIPLVAISESQRRWAEAASSR